MSKNFKNRIDYINIQAYGLGKIKTKSLECGHSIEINSTNHDCDDDEDFDEIVNKEKRLYKRI